MRPIKMSSQRDGIVESQGVLQDVLNEDLLMNPIANCLVTDSNVCCLQMCPDVLILLYIYYSWMPRHSGLFHGSSVDNMIS